MRTALLLLSCSCLLLGGCFQGLMGADVKRGDALKAAEDAEIETYPWPDYVTAEDRNEIDQALHTIFEVGGRDGRDAEAALIAMDREAHASELRAAGRIISEMKNSIDRHGVEDYEGKSRIMVLDRILRRLDGMQERLFGEEYGYDIEESGKKALRLVRCWNWWYREGRFLRRYDPWDPRVDMHDDEEPEDD